MRAISFPVMLACALSAAGCGGSSETYEADVSQTWAKVSGAAYLAAGYGVPSGLAGADVRASFESFPGERTGYWKFTRKGAELGRLNVAVDGDSASSSVSYSYDKGDVGAENETAERLVRQYAQPLIVEAIDATIENRARDEGMKRHADAQSSTAMIGQMMDDVDKSLNGAVARFDEQERDRKRRHANAAVAKARASSTKPTTDLSSYR